MSYIMLLMGFMILVGMALLFGNILKTGTMEGMILSASSVVLILFLTGFVHNFMMGTIILGIAGAAGWVMALIGFFQKKARLSDSLSAVIVALTVTFLLNIFLFMGSYIQYIDELHQWALTVKYMLMNNNLPMFPDYYGDIHQYYGTSLFHLFFQEITGYNEAFMYVSASLLYWIGFLLPFSNFKYKNIKVIAGYILVMFLGLFSMYTYGTKNLYVDLPTIAWAAGLSCWWLSLDENNKKSNKSNYLVLISGLIMVVFFKTYVGLIMAAFVTGLVILNGLIEKGIVESILADKKKCKRVVIVLSVVVILVAAIYAAVVAASVGMKDLPSVKSIIAAYIKAIMQRGLSAKGKFRFTLPAMTIIFCIMMKYVLHMLRGTRQQLRYKFITAYMLIIEVSYIAILMLAYLFVFSYEESLSSAGIARYFSIIGMYLFVVGLVQIIDITVCEGAGTNTDINAKVRFKTITSYGMCGLMLLFALNSSNYFAGTMTAYGIDELDDYEYMDEARREVLDIQTMLSDTDRVYVIDQKGKSEYPTNMAYYYLEDKASNYLYEPWAFTEEGANIRLTVDKSITIADLPAILTNGGYTYIWIYSSDVYLSDELNNVLDVQGNIENNALYKVEYNEMGAAVGMSLACRLK